MTKKPVETIKAHHVRLIKNMCHAFTQDLSTRLKAGNKLLLEF